eukprot:jgi/Tetstr1/453635/TSEL_040591.t1
MSQGEHTSQAARCDYPPRGEGANKDCKHGVLLRTLTLEQAFDRVREVQVRKAKKTEIREIHAGTSRVDADKLCKQWFPDITDKLAEHVSGYATQLCHEEMGSSGNYRVVACHEAAAVPDDEDLEGEVTLYPVAEVPQVDPGMLDLRRLTEHLDFGCGSPFPPLNPRGRGICM